MSTQPRITAVEDAEIRIFDPEPDTDDASRMYVLDIPALDVTVRVRQTKNGNRTRTSIQAETGSDAAWPADFSINDVTFTQGQEPDDDDGEILCRYCEEVIFETTSGLWEAPVDGAAANLCPDSPDDQHAPEPDEDESANEIALNRIESSACDGN